MRIKEREGCNGTSDHRCLSKCLRLHSKGLSSVQRQCVMRHTPFSMHPFSLISYPLIVVCMGAALKLVQREVESLGMVRCQ